MTALTLAEITPLERLAATANAEIVMATEAHRSWVEHATLAGEALLEAWKTVPWGGWGDWVEKNISCSQGTAAKYMRTAYNKDRLAEATTYMDAELALKGGWTLPDRRSLGDGKNGATSKVKAEILSQRAAGRTWQAIAVDMDVTDKTARYWADDAYRDEVCRKARYNERAARERRRLAEETLRRAENAELVRRQGGDASRAYANVRKALAQLDAAISSAELPRQTDRLRTAMAAMYKAEDLIVEAMRQA